MSYDPSTGQWTSQDPIAFDAGDANLYRYVGNDPTNDTDPTGLYDKDVHFYMTYYIAQSIGLGDFETSYKDERGGNVSEAYLIAWSDMFSDVHPSTEPFSSEPARQVFHFVAQGYNTPVEKNSQSAQGFVKTAITQQNTMLFGISLHAYQDTFSHAGFYATPGHLWSGHGPDYAPADMGKAMDMAHGTYTMLAEYMERVHGVKPRVSFGDIADKLRYGLGHGSASMNLIARFSPFSAPHEQNVRDRTKYWQELIRDFLGVMVDHDSATMHYKTIRNQGGTVVFEAKSDTPLYLSTGYSVVPNPAIKPPFRATPKHPWAKAFGDAANLAGP